jgi:hypothetical protein
VDDNEIQVTKLVKLTPHNLKAVLYDLRVQSRTAPSGVLYDRYVEMCRAVDAHPITKNAFGRSLTGQGHVPFYKSIRGKNVRHWQFTREAIPDLRDGEPTELDPDSEHPKIGDPRSPVPDTPPLDPDLWEG